MKQKSCRKNLPSVGGVEQRVRECRLTAVFSPELTNVKARKLHFYTSNNRIPSLLMCTYCIGIHFCVSVHISRSTCDDQNYMFLTAYALRQLRATLSSHSAHFSQIVVEVLIRVGGTGSANRRQVMGASFIRIITTFGTFSSLFEGKAVNFKPKHDILLILAKRFFCSNTVIT